MKVWGRENEGGMGICYMIGAGEIGKLDFNPGKEDLVIACDGGYRHCQKWNIRADLVVGDFDSLGFLPEHPHVVRLKPEKDDTDTGYAVKTGLRKGFHTFVIYGGTGGRVSHTMANIQLLCDLARKGCQGVLIGKDAWFCVICNEEVCFDKEYTGFLSVFCMGDEACGVYETGLKYELCNAVLTKEYPVGVSNEFIGKESKVSVREGMLLLVGENKE